MGRRPLRASLGSEICPNLDIEQIPRERLFAKAAVYGNC